MRTDLPGRRKLAPRFKAVTDLTVAISRLNGLLLQWGDELLAPLGLTGARWQMLGVMSLVGAPLTAPQVGAALGVTRQGAQKQLNLLFAQGLVQARPNPAHKRSPLYVMTPLGRRLNQRAEFLWAHHAADLAALLPAAQVRDATGMLESMLRRLQAAAPAPEAD
jgi:DNA-binding MarR family transcriptional regulator